MRPIVFTNDLILSRNRLRRSQNMTLDAAYFFRRNVYAPKWSVVCLSQEGPIVFPSGAGFPRVARVYIPLGRSVLKKKLSDRPTDRPSIRKK